MKHIIIVAVVAIFIACMVFICFTKEKYNVEDTCITVPTTQWCQPLLYRSIMCQNIATTPFTNVIPSLCNVPIPTTVKGCFMKSCGLSLDTRITKEISPGTFEWANDTHTEIVSFAGATKTENYISYTKPVSVAITFDCPDYACVQLSIKYCGLKTKCCFIDVLPSNASTALKLLLIPDDVGATISNTYTTNTVCWIPTQYKTSIREITSVRLTTTPDNTIIIKSIDLTFTKAFGVVKVMDSLLFRLDNGTEYIISLNTLLKQPMYIRNDADTKGNPINMTTGINSSTSLSDPFGEIIKSYTVIQSINNTNSKCVSFTPANLSLFTSSTATDVSNFSSEMVGVLRRNYPDALNSKYLSPQIGYKGEIYIDIALPSETLSYSYNVIELGVKLTVPKQNPNISIYNSTLFSLGLFPSSAAYVNEHWSYPISLTQFPVNTVNIVSTIRVYFVSSSILNNISDVAWRFNKNTAKPVLTESYKSTLNSKLAIVANNKIAPHPV